MKDGIVNKEEAASGTSLTLLERVRQKDQVAWERLVSLYSPLIYHWCLRSGFTPEDAEEVGQEVFLAVARNIATFRRDREGDTFRGWLRTITRNKIRDRTMPAGGRGEGGSDAQRRLRGLAAPEPETADASADAEEEGLVWRRAVELIEVAFEVNTRRAFWLLLDGRAPADVATELGISTGAVYIAKSRILKRLREEFGELLDLWPTAPAVPPTPN